MNKKIEILIKSIESDLVALKTELQTSGELILNQEEEETEKAWSYRF